MAGLSAAKFPAIHFRRVRNTPRRSPSLQWIAGTRGYDGISFEKNGHDTRLLSHQRRHGRVERSEIPGHPFPPCSYNAPRRLPSRQWIAGTRGYDGISFKKNGHDTRFHSHQRRHGRVERSEIPGHPFPPCSYSAPRRSPSRQWIAGTKARL
jgi:hypothetical protein